MALGWFRRLFGERQPRVQEFPTDGLGILRWDGVADFWTSSVERDGHTIQVWVDGDSAPDPQDVAQAEQLFSSFDEFQQAVQTFLKEEAPRFGHLADEARALKIRLIVFSSDSTPRSAMVWLEGPSDLRRWKVGYAEGRLDGLSFES